MALIRYYKLDGNTNDSTSNADNGTATSITYAAGKSGQAAVFNGTSSYIINGTTINIAVATIACWVNPVALPSATVSIVGFTQGNGSATYDKIIQLDSTGHVFAYAYDGNAKTTSSPASTLSTSTWAFVALTADGTTLTAWVNGVSVGTVACGNTYTGYTASDFLIGGNTTTFATYLHASIQEVRLYDAALSSSGMLQLYNSFPLSAQACL